ncbi:MAG: undecaprenyl-phosphate glucose phosphotransferase [Ignavibacteriae bacterium]|nr:MAG: undecaprenyl-phosphate glucose phosphotransferase [Ignavibacteriota bacterium]
MRHHRRRDLLIPLLTFISDVAAIEAAFLFSYWLRFFSPFTHYVPISYGLPPLDAYVKSSLVVIPVWCWLFNTRHLYAPRRITSFSDEFFAVVRIVVLGMLVVMAGAFFYRSFSYSRIVFWILGFSAVIFISTGRFIIMKFEQWWYTRGHDLQRVLIAGTSTVADRIFRSLTTRRSLGYEVLGYSSVQNGAGDSMAHMPYLGTVDSVPQLIQSKKIDVILIAFNETEQSHLHDLVRDCQGLNVEMMMVPDILELMTSQVQIKHIEGIPFLGIKSPTLSSWNFIVKRTFDLIFAACILLLASPIILLIAILIKLDSKGPIFYLQDRIGLDGEVFQVMKFRSMRIDAEQSTGPVWSKKDDPRTTRLGRFLRRFSFDELPQLVNVLKGNMSVVGPRPERPHFVDKFKNQVPRYLERHRVKTGMTGWAQVNGLRGNTSIAERTRYDIFYIEHWSLVFDLKIILKTIHAVLFGTDAY